MSKKVYTDGDEGVRLVVKTSEKTTDPGPEQRLRAPVHVVYGGADRFKADTVQKLGKIALDSIDIFAASFVEFANAMRIPGTESLPHYPEVVSKLAETIVRDPERARSENFAAWLAHGVYRKTIEKLQTEPIEDFRIDFEDGYGFRPDQEENGEAERAAIEFAVAYKAGVLPTFTGIRIKRLAGPEYARAVNTLDIFLETLVEKTGGSVPGNFVVTLPKVSTRKEVKDLSKRLRRFEKEKKLPIGTVGIELMIESPEAIIDRKGRVPLAMLVKAGKNRVTSAHFGAFDYTAALGIAAAHQSLSHPACDFARNVMQVSLSSLGIRLSDSVTTEMPVAVHRGSELTNAEVQENRRAVHAGWRIHFSNVSRSLSNGFYQGWDLHPHQLPARYAAIYAFLLGSFDTHAARLKSFIDQSRRATLTAGTFDDAASVRGLVNFFKLGFDCGGFGEDEVTAATGVSAEEIRQAGFLSGLDV